MKISLTEMAERAAEAEIFLKQLGNANRLMILCVLTEGELSVGDLNERIPLSQSALSQHLAKLREAGFVATRKESQTVYYQLSDPRVETLIQNLYKIFCD